MVVEGVFVWGGIIMKAELDRSKVTDIIFQISLCFAALCVSAFLAMLAEFLINENVIPIIILGVLTLIFTLLCVVIADSVIIINADNEKIIVVYTIFKKEFLHKNIEYDKIDCTECEVKAVGTRYGGVIYKMYFTVKMKDGSEFSGFEELNMESGLPVSRPDEYKRYISEQPLQKLCDFINEQIQTRV